MFDPGQTPRVFYLAPGVDFAAAFADGLMARMAGQPPEAMARVQVYLNSDRMRRLVTEALTQSGARFLPRLRVLTELSRDPVLADQPPPVPPLRRRLELAQLIARLLDAQPGLAPRAALYDLSDSLATLLDEMGGEGVSAARIASVDVSGHSAHWTRTQTFLGIIEPFLAEAQDIGTRARHAAERLALRWQDQPPADPVIVAGSTGSRGATRALMEAVARLPQGAVVLPGFDALLPAQVWAAMDDAMTAEDHPQYRMHRLMVALGLDPARVPTWHTTAPADLPRNHLISLSLRPAPVTDQWLVDGPALRDLRPITEQMTLIEASSPRAEALSIALILRGAVADGTTAALITPDRTLSRQVTAALDRWGILPDDSAGQPLAPSAQGRFLRHVAGLFGQRMTAERLLTLLKHPLAGSGARANHLRLTRMLEVQLRKAGPAFPDGAMVSAWAADKGAADWAAALTS
ncbi:MAG: double-strand break repair protein AddB, partial [Paracoccaceae bacterium]